MLKRLASIFTAVAILSLAIVFPARAESVTRTVTVTDFKGFSGKSCTITATTLSFQVDTANPDDAPIPPIEFSCVGVGKVTLSNYLGMATFLNSGDISVRLNLSRVKIGKVSIAAKWPETLASDCTPQDSELSVTSVTNGFFKFPSVELTVSSSQRSLSSWAILESSSIVGDYVTNRCGLVASFDMPRSLKAGASKKVNLESHVGKVVVEPALNPGVNISDCTISLANKPANASGAFFLESTDKKEAFQFFVDCGDGYTGFSNARVFAKITEGATVTLNPDFRNELVHISGTYTSPYADCQSGKLVFNSADGMRSYSKTVQVGDGGSYNLELPRGKYMVQAELQSASEAQKCAPSPGSVWVTQPLNDLDLTSTYGTYSIALSDSTECDLSQGFDGAADSVTGVLAQSAEPTAVKVTVICGEYAIDKVVAVTATSGSETKIVLPTPSHKLVQVSGEITLPSIVTRSTKVSLSMMLAPSANSDGEFLGWYRYSPYFSLPLLADLSSGLSKVNPNKYVYSIEAPEGAYKANALFIGNTSSGCIPLMNYYRGPGLPANAYYESSASVEVASNETDTATGINLALQAGSRFTGKTIPKAEVSFKISDANKNLVTWDAATADRKGKYTSTRCLGAGSYSVQVEASAPGNKSLAIDALDVTATSGSNINLDFASNLYQTQQATQEEPIDASMSISGKLIPQDGSSVLGTWVMASCNSGQVAIARSDEQGKFSLEGLANGNVCRLQFNPGNQDLYNIQTRYSLLGQTETSNSDIQVEVGYTSVDLGDVPLVFKTQTSVEPLAFLQSQASRFWDGFLEEPADEAVISAGHQFVNFNSVINLEGNATLGYSPNVVVDAPDLAVFDVYYYEPEQVGVATPEDAFIGKSVAFGDRIVLPQNVTLQSDSARIVLQRQGRAYGQLYVLLRQSSAPTQLQGPSLSGNAKVKSTMKVDSGQWVDVNGLNTQQFISYQWIRCDSAKTSKIDSVPSDCAAIADATGATYKATTKDRGKFLMVQVTITNNMGSSTAYTVTSSKVK